MYATDAFAAFRNRVWDSLDESGDITSFQSSSGDNILDFDNPACGVGGSNGDGTFKTDLSGYLTIDVVNFCTNYFPENELFYNEDAIATTGWSLPADATVGGCTQSYTPNALMGDVFYIDTASQGGNISGDQAIAIEFDPDLDVRHGSRPSRPSSASSSPPAAAAPRRPAEAASRCGVPAGLHFPR